MRLLFVTLVLLWETSLAFSPLQKNQPSSITTRSPHTAAASIHYHHHRLLLPPLPAQKSRVVDEDGPTPEIADDDPLMLDPNDIPELHYDESVHPIPHQPWRRGTTEGCEDPIEAPWRREAELIISKAVEMVGGTVVDVTWYLTQVVVTVDSLETVEEYTMGPEIIIAPDDNGPEFIDPEDPNPEVIWDDEEEYLYERDDDSEEEDEADKLRKTNMYKHDPDHEEPKNPVPLYARYETRDDMAAMTADEEARLENEERPMDSSVFEINTPALSTVAGAILNGLEAMEDVLHVLERHEVVLTSPGAPDMLESQGQFDANQGANVIVETQDPFGSNRVLKGTLLARNSMDVVINKQGRMVTIPHNFVKAVKLAAYRGAAVEKDEDEL